LAPPPRPPGCADEGTATMERSTARPATCAANVVALLSIPMRMIISSVCRAGRLDTRRHRNDDIYLADLGHDGLQVAHDLTVEALDDRAGIERLDLRER